MRNYKSIILPVLGFLLGFLLCLVCTNDFEKYVEIKEIIRDTANHEGCLKAGWYGNYKQVTN
jgi:hypothetical protein